MKGRLLGTNFDFDKPVVLVIDAQFDHVFPIRGKIINFFIYKTKDLKEISEK